MIYSDDIFHVNPVTNITQERSGTDLDDALTSLDEYKDNIYVIEQLVQNDVSSTKIRMFVKRGMLSPISIKNSGHSLYVLVDIQKLICPRYERPVSRPRSSCRLHEITWLVSNS